MRMKDVNSVLFMKIDEICGKKKHKASLRNFDMASLPPCRRTLDQHVGKDKISGDNVEEITRS